MDVVWVILVVVAVGIAAAFVVIRRSRAGRFEGAEERAEVEGAGTAAVRAPEPPVEVEAAGPEAAPTPAAAPAREVAAAGRETKRELSEKELRSQVEARLRESERMLGELRKAAEHDAAVAQRVGAGTVGLMGEGLEEVRSLAERKKWSQARNKGEALHAQLSLMLQSARREQTT